MRHEPADIPSPDPGPPGPAAFVGRVIFTPTPQDLAAAYQRHGLDRLWSRRTLAAFCAVAAVLAGVLVLAAIDLTWILLAVVCAVAGGLLGSRITIRWYVPVAARRLYRQQRNLQDEVAAEWDTGGLQVVTGTAQSRTPWAHYQRWSEDEGVVLLYHSDLLFQFIPKRVLTAGQVDALRALVAGAGVRGA